MTRLLPWFGVACVVLLAAVGGISVTAAEADEEATLTQADLEVRKAELRVQWAEENLADAQARVDAGTADRGATRAAERELERANLALLETRIRVQEWESQKVSLDVQDAWLDDALRLIFRRTPYSYVLSPEIRRLDLDPLTIRLKEVDLQTAVRVICDTYDLLYRKEDSIYYFFPRSDVVTIGGRRVPVFGAVQVPSSDVSRSIVMKTSDVRLAEGRGYDLDLAPDSTEKPIDLQVENVPIREATARLAEAAEMEIMVHEAVPEDIRITAKVYRMSGYRLLHEIVDQAGLTLVQERVEEVIDEDGRVTRLPPDVPPQRHRRVLRGRAEATETRVFHIFHVVPKPELSVSGTGVGQFSGMSGLAGMVDSSILEALERYEPETGESIISFGLRLCPECEQLMLMPDWRFCPHCGAELPCDEEPDEPSR